MKTKFEIVAQMFHGFDYSRYFIAPTGERLQILLGAQNHILRDEKVKDRYLAEV